MAREVVTGYCWPQSARSGGQVGLHLSSSGGRPVRVEVARVGARREVVFSCRRGRRRRARDAEGRRLEGVRLARRARRSTSIPTWRSGYYEVVMEIDVGDKVRRDYAFFVVRPSSGTRIVLALATNTWHAYNDFGGPNLYTGGTHVAMQRPMSAGLPLQAAGQGPPGHRDGRARSAERRARRLHPDQPSLGLCRVGGLARLGAAVHRVGRTRGIRDRRVHERRSRRAPRGIGRRQSVSVRRPRRVLVPAACATRSRRSSPAAATRPSSRATRRLWQVRIEGDDHDVMVGYKGFFKNDPLMGTDREAEVTTFWSDVVVGRPENHMTGVSFTRGGYHRIGRNVTAGLGGYTVHRAGHWIFEGTGLGYGDVLGAGADRRRLRVRRVRVHLPRRSAVPDRRGRHAVDLRDPRHVPDAALHPRRPRLVRPSPASRASWSTSHHACSGRVTPRRWSASVTATPCSGAYTNEAGATVVTSGSTDWAHGLAGRDPQIEQITRNVLTRLG